MLDPNLTARLEVYADVVMYKLARDTLEFNVPQRLLVEAIIDALISKVQYIEETE